MWESLAPGEVKEPSITPSLAEAPGRAPVEATLEAGEGTTVGQTRYEVQVVSETVSVRDRLFGDREQVTNEVVEPALRLWERDQVVGGTGGERVSDELMLELIRRFRENRGER
jgi:hypothetical protein